MNETINLTIPAPPGQTPESIKGQWVSLVAFGQVYVAQIEEVTPLPWDAGRVTLLARTGEPDVEPAPEPEFIAAPRTGTHINCPHSDSPMDVEEEMICSDISQEDTQDLGPYIAPIREDDGLQA